MDSPPARDLFEELRRRFGRVIVDTPPVVPFSDVSAIGRMNDDVVMVVRRGRTPVDLYLQALESLGSTRLFGVVLNDSGRNIVDRHTYYDRYYSQYYKPSVAE